MFFGSLRVVLVLGDPGVDELCPVLHHLADQTLLAELVQRLPGQRAAHLEPLAHDGRRDELVGGDLLQQLVVGGLVEEDQVVELVPGLALGPLLLLGLSAAGPVLGPLAHDGRGDQLVGGHLFQQLVVVALEVFVSFFALFLEQVVVGGLVEQDQVVELVLGPFLLLLLGRDLQTVRR